MPPHQAAGSRYRSKQDRAWDLKELAFLATVTVSGGRPRKLVSNKSLGMLSPKEAPRRGCQSPPGGRKVDGGGIAWDPKALQAEGHSRHGSLASQALEAAAAHVD